MKFLILGSGSIAIRHYNNLKKIGYKNINFFTKNQKFSEKNYMEPFALQTYTLKKNFKKNPSMCGRWDPNMAKKVPFLAKTVQKPPKNDIFSEKKFFAFFSGKKFLGGFGG